MDPIVTKMTKAGSAYYSIHWSRLRPLVKDVVTRSIPSEAGIFEVYRYRGGPTAELVGRARAYYGGLRNTMRGLIDTTSPYPLNGRLLPPEETHLVRYVLSNSSDDMTDVMFFFASRDEYADEDQEHSGRYEFIYVKEILPHPTPNEVTPA